jgi:hypothetical protein
MYALDIISEEKAKEAKPQNDLVNEAPHDQLARLHEATSM